MTLDSDLVAALRVSYALTIECMCLSALVGQPRLRSKIYLSLMRQLPHVYNI